MSTSISESLANSKSAMETLRAAAKLWPDATLHHFDRLGGGRVSVWLADVASRDEPLRCHKLLLLAGDEPCVLPVYAFEGPGGSVMNIASSLHPTSLVRLFQENLIVKGVVLQALLHPVTES